MTAPTGIRSGVGFRNCVVFELDANGWPKATSTTAYEGVRISGAKVLTINDPEPRRISHIGDDSIISIDVLPPTEAITGELRVGKLNDVMDAILTGQKKFSISEIAMFGVGTNKRGYEPQVGLLAYRQAQDTDPTSATYGLRTWEMRILPKVQLIAREVGFNDQPEDFIYTVIPARCTSHLWGVAFDEATEGFTMSQMVRGVSFKKPKIVAWKADGTEDEFLFPTDAQAASTDVITVWENGAIVTTGLTKAVNKLTYSSPPTNGHIIVCMYQEA